MVGIYGIRNEKNKKWYVGQSRNIKKRVSNHFNSAFRKNSSSYDSLFSRAIRKYGKDSFTVHVLEECSISELNNREIYWIKKKNSIKNGYNISEGGASGLHLTKMTKKKFNSVVKDLKSGKYTSDEIGRRNSISGRLVRDINRGEAWYTEGITYPIVPKKSPTVYRCVDCGKVVSQYAKYCRKCFTNHRFVNKNGKYFFSEEKLPNIAEVTEKLKELNGNFAAVGRIYGVNAGSVKKWLMKHNLPFHSCDYKHNSKNLKSLSVDKIISVLKSKGTLQAASKEFGVSTNVIRTFLKKHGFDYKQYTFNPYSKPVLCVETGEIFPSANAAAASLSKKKNTHIVDCCNGKIKSAYGFTWKYI